MGEHEQTGKIAVHSVDIRDQLVEDERNFSASQFLERHWKARTEPMKKTSESAATQDIINQAVHVKQSTLTDWLKCDITPVPGPVSTMYQAIFEDEETFIKEVDEYLQEKDLLNKRRKEMLYKKWREQVFEPIQAQVIEEVAGPAYKWLDNEKRQLFERYLNYTNRKGFVYLDTFSADEYDPLVLTRPNSPLRATTARLNDPLISQQHDRSQEEHIIDACEYGLPTTTSQLKSLKHPLVPLGRHGTECSTWLAMELTHIDSQVRTRSRQRMRKKSNETSTDFEQWSNTPRDPKLIDQEMQLQHKRFYKAQVKRLDLSMVS